MSVNCRKRVVKLVSHKKMTWENYLKEYLLWKKAEGRSERTIRDYSNHIRLFFKRFPDSSFSNLRSFKKNIIEHMSLDVKPAYYNNKLVYLKTFFEWCVNEGILAENPMKSFKRRKADERIVQID
ncbi:site-specific recombinase XerD [Desulfocucumis palustris]|uniref:Site-specific recombinase XerD n=1 Tax=Desulfocucumis palustris TaxID=1898651 RepID=A0A2L2XL54_9FIRM|nr:site-specific recombinase XerD [Desulfocucumis palustris]